ncbi:MAG: 1-acyl-sn-glycerol-3-phosphate acyltransferase [Pseudomonadota bacterium]
MGGPRASSNNKNKYANRSPWPDVDAGKIVFLLDARDDFEASLLRDWVTSQEASAKPDADYLALPRDGAGSLLDGLDTTTGSVWMQPLRIAWLPPSHTADRRSRLNSLLGRFAEPGKTRRRWLAKYQPERLAYIVGDGAWLNDLHDRLAGSGAPVADDELSEFVTNQAMIALERTERSVRGARYKVPRIRHSDVFANRDYRAFIANTAQQRDRSTQDVLNEAVGYLREMAAMQTPFTLDTINGLYRVACRSHHDAEINVDQTQLATVAETLSTRPVVFLISHKSMLDTAALSLVLFEADLPLPLTFGGINLNTPGLGALARRSGIIFLRRSFQDNEIYKATFRRYIDYLIEKRFSLLWALEGTRSRTGKLMPPRFGLFNYVVESILRTKLFDVTFIPVSVAYDQITEVEDYSIEQRGQKKKPEGITWPLRFLRRGRSRGQIHLRFGESLTLRDLTEPGELDAGIDTARKQVLVPTLAFEVAVRMNAATPITATAIVTLILLGGGNRALSLEQIKRLARAGSLLLRRRKLEIVGRSDFDDDDAVRATLAELHATEVIEYRDEGTERLYGIAEDQHLNAAYYRNTAIHYFILDAFVEVALLEASSETDDPGETVFRKATELRELFKFEFYLPRSADYRAEIEKTLGDRFSNWEELVSGDEADLLAKFETIQPLVAHGVLRSFVDAYRIVMNVLAAEGDSAIDDEGDLIGKCLKMGKQQLLQGRIFSAESISKSLYATACKLARYRGLLDADQTEARQSLHAELRSITKRLDQILAITLARAEDD